MVWREMNTLIEFDASALDLVIFDLWDFMLWKVKISCWIIRKSVDHVKAINENSSVRKIVFSKFSLKLIR